MLKSPIMVKRDDATTIKISRITKQKLDKHGKFPDTYEGVLNRVLDEYENLEKQNKEITNKLKFAIKKYREDVGKDLIF